MIFIQTDSQGYITTQHNFPFHKEWGMKKTEEQLKKEGFLVEAIPEVPVQEGKEGKVKYINGDFEFDYVEIVPTKDEEIEKLKLENEQLKNSLADLWEVVLLGGNE